MEVHAQEGNEAVIWSMEDGGLPLVARLRRSMQQRLRLEVRQTLRRAVLPEMASIRREEVNKCKTNAQRCKRYSEEMRKAAMQLK